MKLKTGRNNDPVFRKEGPAGAIMQGSRKLPYPDILYYGLCFTGAILLVYGIYLVFYVAPEEAVMGFSQKIFYIHVPCAWVMFLGVVIGAISGLLFLVKNNEKADIAAKTGVEIGALFGLAVLVTGPLWANSAWGTPWIWDARLTTTLILELILIASLMVRAYGGIGAARIASAITVFGFVQIPIVYFSVDIWRGQHPGRIVAEGGLDPDMKFALYVCTLAFMFLFGALFSAAYSTERAGMMLNDMHNASWLPEEKEDTCKS